MIENQVTEYTPIWGFPQMEDPQVRWMVCSGKSHELRYMSSPFQEISIRGLIPGYAQELSMTNSMRTTKAPVQEDLSPAD